MDILSGYDMELIGFFSKFWSDAGWFANFLTVMTPLATFGFLLYKASRSKLDEIKIDYPNMEGYVKSKGDRFSDDVKHKKIAIVDDQPENYPIDYLRRISFYIQVFEKVSLSNFDFLNDYDLIFMDVTNVVEEDPSRGGFELIKKVREKFKDKVIIGVSSKKFDPTLTEFFKMCNTQCKTPIIERECEDLITEQLNKHFSPRLISRGIDEMLNQSNLKGTQYKNIIKVMVSFFEKGDFDRSDFVKRISKISHDVNAHMLFEKCELLNNSANS